MNVRGIHRLESLRAAHQFIINHAAELGSVPGCGSHRRLSAGLERADAYANTQAVAQIRAQSATRVLHRRRTALLRDHLAPLVAIATAPLVAMPGVEPFRMPPRWARVEQLRAYAVGMVEGARPFTRQFVPLGLPADFAERIVAAAQAFADAANERRHHRMRAF